MVIWSERVPTSLHCLTRMIAKTEVLPGRTFSGSGGAQNEHYGDFRKCLALPNVATSNVGDLGILEHP